jgi:hypothetical protein
MANGDNDTLSKPEISPDLLVKYQEMKKTMDTFREMLKPQREEIEGKLKEMYNDKVKGLIDFEGKDRITFSFDVDKTPIEVVFKIKRNSL